MDLKEVTESIDITSFSEYHDEPIVEIYRLEGVLSGDMPEWFHIGDHINLQEPRFKGCIYRCSEPIGRIRTNGAYEIVGGYRP